MCPLSSAFRRFLPRSAAVRGGLPQGGRVKFSPAVSFFHKKPWRKSNATICNYLLASAYSCLQSPAIDYLYRIGKVYNYLLHFPAFRGIVYMLLAVFRCEPFLLWGSPRCLWMPGVFLYLRAGHKKNYLRSITKEGQESPSFSLFRILRKRSPQMRSHVCATRYERLYQAHP